MTLEKRCLIEFSDIVGVELECSHCHTKTTFPSFNLEKLSSQCQNCRELFFDPRTGLLQTFAELGNMIAAVRRENPKGIRLQIRCED